MQDRGNQPFSKRFGHIGKDQKIKVREDAPQGFRYAVIEIAIQKGNLNPSSVRSIVCRVLRKRPDRYNWSEYPNVYDEVHSLVESCEWYHVYDIVEAIYASLEDHEPDVALDYEGSINECLIDMEIGWKLVGGIIETRGEEPFEKTIEKASEALDKAGLNTSKQELAEAIRDLSRRPEPDLSGAIHHSMASLECVARELSGDRKRTLGEIIKQHPELVPKPLDEAISKVWGYSSDVARHARENRSLEREEAELVVSLAAAIATYLVEKSL